MTRKLYPALPDHPEYRCKSTAQNKHCTFLSCDGLRKLNLYDDPRQSDKCPKHAGRPPSKQTALAKYMDTHPHEVGYHLPDQAPKVHSQSRSVAEELHILRTLLQNTLNQCNTSLDLLANTERMTVLSDKIANLIKTDVFLEEKTKNSLTRDQIMAVLSEIQQVITRHCSPEQVALIRQDFQELTIPD
tara:strand:+ start:521 stop:1084 length:564 start_codon:yes stop_codon:yes gene_type:complete